MHTAALPTPTDLPRPGGMPRWRRPLPLVALLGWVVPGLGHALLGQWRAATLMMGAILALYCGGLALTDFTAVDPTLHGLEFIAHVFAGGPTALAVWLTEGHEPTRFLPYLDIGRLYVAVASLLNLVAVTDAIEKAARQNHQYGTWRFRHRQALQAVTHQAPLESAAAGQALPHPGSTADAAPGRPPAGSWSAPLDAGPAQAAPTDAAPFDAAPFDAAPFDAAPFDAAPIDAAPIDTTPLDTTPPDKPLPGSEESAS